MALFGPEFLEELRDRTSLSDLVGRRVQLRKRGAEHTGLCPFHNEKTPSFTLNDDKGFYHCFGCGAHGNAIDWVMQMDGLEFVDAVKRLAEDANMALPAAPVRDPAIVARRQTAFDVLEAACTWFQQQLAAPAGRAARDYLAGRGLDAATIERFRLGYAPNARGALLKAVVPDGESGPLIDAGLMKAADENGPLRDYFFDRVMFPILDRKGQVIGFGGRAMGDSPAKYINSPDTDIFHKGETLYNIGHAQRAAREAGSVIVVEGYMDVIGLSRAGFDNVVAPLGTALTERQVALAWRMCDEPVLCFDGDAAGTRAAARAAERTLPLLQPGKSLQFVSLPSGEDPDSLVRKAGRRGFEAVLAERRPLIDVIWASAVAGRTIDTPERRAALQADLGKQAARIADETVRRNYGQMLRDRAFRAFSPWRLRNGGSKKQTGVYLGKKRAPRNHDQEVLLATAINHPGILEAVFEPLSAMAFTNADLARLRDEIVAWAIEAAGADGASDTSAINPSNTVDREALHHHLCAVGCGPIVDALLSNKVYVTEFGQPSASDEEARKGWLVVHAGIEAKSVEKAKLQALDSLGNDFSEDDIGLIERLAEQERMSARSVDEPAE